MKPSHIRNVLQSPPILPKPLVYLAVTGTVLMTVVLAFGLNRVLPHASLSLLFLTLVLVVSAKAGLGPSLFASVLSFLAYNFFFTSPHYTFQVTDEGDLATLAFFLVMAAISGNLAARMQAEMAKRQVSLQRIENLYAFSRQMSSAAGSQEVLDALAAHLSGSLNLAVAVYIAAENEALVVKARMGDCTTLREEMLVNALSKQSCDQSQPLQACDSWQLLPLATVSRSLGLVAVNGALDDEQHNLARNLCDQAAVALDRTRLVSKLEDAKLVSETEQLRSALLSSISHDLRTPLATIIGATTSLLEYGESFSQQNRTELLAGVVDEAQRLDRHIQNLLDMTRLGQGGLSLRRDWVDVQDIVYSAANRLRDALKKISLVIHFEGEIPLLWAHGALIEQALVNLLDNAIRFSAEGGEVRIVASSDAGQLEIRLCDQGPGIPLTEREKVFDMFYTVDHGDWGRLRGTGLGLAICRGMVAAHGGTVQVEEGCNGRGTCMHVSLPLHAAELPGVGSGNGET